MHNVCDSTAYSMSLRDAIDLGWLVPIRQKYITVDGLNLEDVDIVNGDLANDQRERAYLGDSDEREQALLHGVAKPLIDELVGDRQAILFSPGQEHAAKITAALNSYPGVYAACVIDSTIPSERDRIVEDYKLGAIKILVNCMVFSEGFDAPKTSVIANCRSTKSKSLIAQFIGRGTRPLPGVVDGPTTPEGRKEAIAKSEKPSCLVLDFVGSAKVRLASAVDLLAGEDVDPIDIEEAIRVSRESGEFDPREALSRAQQSRKEREAKSKKVLVTRTRAASAEYSADEIDLDDDRENDEIDAYYVTRIRPTRITRAQLNLLARLGYDRSAAKKLTKKGASKAISRALAVARNKAQSRYQQQFHSATTIGELHQIGGQIKRAIECGDAVYRDVAFQQRLRNAFTARAKEIKGVQ
jgi:superfamily II DNA or RNA helicase